MTIQTNVCETCGDGKFTVTHHEAAHRCPVCEMLSDLDDARAQAQGAEALEDQISDLEDRVKELEEELREARQ